MADALATVSGSIDDITVDGVGDMPSLMLRAARIDKGASGSEVDGSEIVLGHCGFRAASAIPGNM